MLTAPGDFTHARHFAGARHALAQAQSLPPWTHTDPRFFAREMERIFRRHWLFAGDADRISKPGDWWSTALAGVPVLLARGRDGAVRAFANTCRHRGCRLVPPGEGNARAFKCGYHGWIYNLDGALAGAPQMEHSKDFDKSAYGLVAIRAALWGKFVFLCFDANAPPFEEAQGGFLRMFQGYEFDRLVTARRARIRVRCNWKIYAENLMESYHIPYVHAASIAGNDFDPGMEALAGKSGGLYGRTPGQPVWLDFGPNHGAIVSRHAGSNGLLPNERGFPAMPGLSGVAAEGSYFAYPFPCALIAGNIDCLWTVGINPLSAGETELTLAHHFHQATMARPDFAELSQAYYRRLDAATAEDVVITEEQQRGLASPFARPGRLSHMEPVVHQFRRWIVDQVAD